MGNKIMLISMPWHQADILSLQIGCLKAFLKKNNVKVDSRHYYKDIISYIDIDTYKKILYSNVGEVLFAALLFPEKKKDIKKVVMKKLGKNFNFNQVLRNIKKFIYDILKDVTWANYSLVGFTTTHEQTVSSLLLAKLLKSEFPTIKIVFGGILLVDEIAINLIKTFPFIDYVVMGEGEIPFLNLVYALRKKIKFSKIPSLVYRKNDIIYVNKKKKYISNLNNLPIPNYEDYFNYSLLPTTKILHPKISIEASRGCWWGRCTFCIENTRWRKPYRRKTANKVIEEIKYLTKKYNSLDLIFCDSDVSDKIDIFRKIKNLNLDFNISVEVTGFITKDALKILRDAGVKNIQIGIEAFNEKLLKIYNKGVNLIKMIELLKWCKELGINLSYNIIIGSPFETKRDIKETIRNVKYLKFFQPPYISNFVVSYQSQIYYSPEKYEITKLLPSKETRKCYPKEVSEKLTPLLSFHAGYEFKPKNKLNYNSLLLEVKRWRKYANYKPTLVCHRGEDFLDIEVKAKTINHIIIKGGLEKNIYLFCIDRSKNLNEIYKQFSNVPKERIQKILKKFIRLKLMFTDGARYLSLASLKKKD